MSIKAREAERPLIIDRRCRKPRCHRAPASSSLCALTPALGAVFALSMLVLLIQLVLLATQQQLLLALGAIVVLMVLPFTRRRILGLAGWIFSLQMATTRAIINGIGGRWGVWSKTRS